MTGKVIPLFDLESTEPTVINEAYFESLSNDQLAYRAWSGCDLAEEVLFDDGACEDSRNDARLEVLMAQYALRVLVRRMTGRAATDIRDELTRRFRESAGLEPGGEQ